MRLNSQLCRIILLATLCPLVAVTLVAQSDIEKSLFLDYQVTRVITPSKNKKNGYSLVIVKVNSKHFNRKDMTALAAQLNKEFAQEPRMHVALFDENTPWYILEGGGEIPTFYAEMRGQYSVDRIRCKEYIRFSRAKNKPQSEVIRFKCSRSR